MITRRNFTRLSLFGLGIGLANCTSSSQSLNPSTNPPNHLADIRIWWEQGYLPEENAGIIEIVRQWEKATGLKADLKLMHITVLQTELLKAIANPETSDVPDIVFAISLDANLAPKLAWENRLADVSDIMEKNREFYASDALSQVTYRNHHYKENRFYAIPIGNAGEYIHCWGTFLEQIERSVADIPQEWGAFWQFWQEGQEQLRQQQYPELYGIGLCMSASGVDTFTSLRWFLDAHNATIVSDEGGLVLPEPENRQKLAEVLQEYTSFYKQGFVPPEATDWTASGNNSRFLQGSLLMTHNPTLSIPLTQKLKPNPYNQDAIERYQQIVTLNWPHKIDGTPMQPRKGIKQFILPKAGQNPEAARDFATYLIDPEHLNKLLKEGFKGRFLPVMPQLLTDPYWRNEEDPHISKAIEIQQQSSPIPYEILHPAYSQILGQQIWGRTILKILKEGASAENAADWAIAQIETIWQNWEQL